MSFNNNLQQAFWTNCVMGAWSWLLSRWVRPLSTVQRKSQLPTLSHGSNLIAVRSNSADRVGLSARPSVHTTLSPYLARHVNWSNPLQRPAAANCWSQQSHQLFYTWLPTLCSNAPAHRHKHAGHDTLRESNVSSRCRCRQSVNGGMESPNWQVTTLDIHLHGPRQTAEQTGTTTCGSRLGRSDVLRCLRHSLLKQNREVELLLSCLRHFVLVTIDRLDDRSEENP